MTSGGVFELCDRLANEYLRLSPILATQAGVPGHDHRWDDFSPDGIQAKASLLESFRHRFQATVVADDRWDRLALRVVRVFLDEQLDAIAHHEPLYDLNSVASPLQYIRQVFDLMDTSGDEAWENLVARLESLDEVLGGYRRALEAGAEMGRTAARRQVEAAVQESRAQAGDDSYFLRLPARATAGLEDRVRTAAGHAVAAFQRFADFLEVDYAPRAVAEDAVGPERYARNARRYLGTTVDLAETYRWGWEQVAGLRARMHQVAGEIAPTRSLAEVVRLVESDPDRSASSPAEFIRIMSERQQTALRRLDGTHFDIPEPVKGIEVRIAPPGGSLGAYYVQPSEDWRRPGTIWYSIGAARVLPLWDEVSTAYHEGFPGHHLQSGIQLSLADRLSRLHRLLVWYPGYGEGWALYAEALMEELGFLEKPEYVLGMLAGEMLRACRVVIDIGSHLGFPIPAGAVFHPGEAWTFELAVEMLTDFAFLSADHAESEVIRYLGWPGQAISYKVGERVILELRDEMKRRCGSRFDLKDFHAVVLGTGPVGLDHLRELVLGDPGS